MLLYSPTRNVPNVGEAWDKATSSQNRLVSIGEIKSGGQEVKWQRSYEEIRQQQQPLVRKVESSAASTFRFKVLWVPWKPPHHCYIYVIIGNIQAHH